MTGRTKASTGAPDFAAKPKTDTAIEVAERKLTAPPRTTEPGVMTVREFAEWARVGYTTVYAEIGAGRLAVAKIGRSTHGRQGLACRLDPHSHRPAMTPFKAPTAR